MNSLGRKVLLASTGALILLGGGYALVERELAERNAASAYVMRDYRRALLDGDIHAALTRAMGETASYSLTGNTEYEAEAATALEQAHAAVTVLRRIASEAPARSDEVNHVRLLDRQERLLRLAQERLNRARATPAGPASSGGVDALAWIYAHEAEADTLWLEIVAHHRKEQVEHEQAVLGHSRRDQMLVLAAVAAYAALIGLVFAYVRRRVVSPLTALARLAGSVAAGDLTRRAEVTHGDEIGQLQRSFNRMVVDLERQRGELSALLENLARSRDAAQAANRAKSDFLANVSHEIRTPMNGVVVSLDLMHETTPSKEQRDLADLARTSARSLLGMLNDLLDFSRIEAGRLELESVSFEPRRLVTQMVDLHGKRAQAKGLAMSCRVAADVPAKLCGDPVRLGQVLLNLLDNAIKFTERGAIEVSVSVDPPACAPVQPPTGATEPPVLLRVRVTDSGIGIAPEAVQKIFQPFYQAEGSVNRKYGGVGHGLGLGLGIARQLVRKMGGELGFEGELGKGSSFWFTARLLHDSQCQAAEVAEVQPRRQFPEGKAVLLVEDHRDSREVMARVLQRRGLNVTTAQDGLVALEMASAQEFDLVLMDCRMPNMDGFEATRAIRALSGGRARVPIIALTAYGLIEPRQRYLDAGFDDLVVKPYTLEDIEEAIWRWLVLGRRDNGAPPGASVAAAGPGVGC
ncbi:MAG: response regulator [Burkholderiaceae bacterium]